LSAILAAQRRKNDIVQQGTGYRAICSRFEVQVLTFPTSHSIVKRAIVITSLDVRRSYRQPISRWFSTARLEYAAGP